MKKDHYIELFRLFSRLKTSKRAELFLRDILTPSELDRVAERWQIVKRLAGGMPQRTVKSQLRISIEKVTRGSKAFQKNKGGFRLFLS